MALKITEDCIKCAACEIECPYEAIYPGGVNWRAAGNEFLHFCKSPKAKDDFFSELHYYIVPDECSECKGISDIPKCVMICPVSGIIPDIAHRETEEHLYSKKNYLDTRHPWKYWN